MHRKKSVNHLSNLAKFIPAALSMALKQSPCLPFNRLRSIIMVCKLAMDSLKEGGQVDRSCKLRQIKYLNNIVEQDHRFIKRRVGPGLGFDSFRREDMTLRDYEAMNMIRKGQIEGVGKENIIGQVKFIESLFGIAA